MTEKTEQELLAEQAQMQQQIAENTRQLTLLSISRIENFAAVLAERITAEDIAAIKAAAVSLTDFGALYSRNLIQLLESTPSLMEVEAGRLKSQIAPTPTPAPVQP